MKMIYLIVVASLTTMAQSVLTGCKNDANENLVTIPSGQQWSEWSRVQRNNAVFEYLQGYYDGANMACKKANELFETDKTHSFRYYDKASTFPSDRCRESIEQYSRVKINKKNHGYDCSDYTNAITEFYAKHPEYRSIQFTVLMHHLSDKQGRTSEDLYLMAKRGEISPI